MAGEVLKIAMISFSSFFNVFIIAHVDVNVYTKTPMRMVLFITQSHLFMLSQNSLLCNKKKIIITTVSLSSYMNA